MTSMIERFYVEYSHCWFGECDEAVAARMTEIEQAVAAAIPQSLADRAMQYAIRICEDGCLDDAKLLAQPPSFAPIADAGNVSAVAQFYFEWEKADGRDAIIVDLPADQDAARSANLSRLEIAVVETPSEDAGDVSLKTRYCRIQNERGYEIAHVLDGIERDLVRLNAARA